MNESIFEAAQSAKYDALLESEGRFGQEAIDWANQQTQDLKALLKAGQINTIIHNPYYDGSSKKDRICVKTLFEEWVTEVMQETQELADSILFLEEANMPTHYLMRNTLFSVCADYYWPIYKENYIHIR